MLETALDRISAIELSQKKTNIVQEPSKERGRKLCRCFLTLCDERLKRSVLGLGLCRTEIQTDLTDLQFVLILVLQHGM